MALYNRYETVGSIIRTVCGLIGLERPTVVVNSQDTVVIQLLEMLIAKGRELSDQHQWQQFERRGEVVIGPSTLNGILLPDDWGGFINRTGWNENSDVRLIGPLDAVDWQTLKVTGLAGSNFNLRYRLRGSELYFEDYPDEDTTISFEYYSRGWVQDFVADPPIYRDYCENDGDIVLFDSLMMQYAVRLMWLESKGFATASAQKDFDTRFASVRSRDKDAPTLALARRMGARLIGSANVPDTGIGQ